jgi:hypothetical protein
VLSEFILFVSEAPDFVAMGLPTRRLDDRIRDLCAEAIAAKSSHNAKPILAELQSAIHEFTERLRKRVAAVLTRSSDFPIERRRTSRHRGQRAG